MKKNLASGDRIIDDDGEQGTVESYTYPHFHPDGLILYTLDDGRECWGNAHGIKKVVSQKPNKPKHKIQQLSAK